MHIRSVRPDDAAAWLRMRETLWPSAPGEHAGEIRAAAHRALGFTEVARIVCFRKSLT